MTTRRSFLKATGAVVAGAKIEEGPHGTMRPLGSRSIDCIGDEPQSLDDLMKGVYRSMLDEMTAHPVHEPTLHAMLGALKP